MKRTLLLFVCLFVLSVLAAAQNQTPDKTWYTGQAVRAEFKSGDIDLELGSGDATVQISPGATEIVVTPESQNEADLGRFKIHIRANGSTTKLNVSGPHNHARYKVQIPSPTHLKTHMAAGDLKVDGLAGSADILLHAGDCTVKLAAPVADFGPVDLSVKVGDLTAAPFATSKGGFFRHFHNQTAAKYALKVHVGTGDLNIE